MKYVAANRNFKAFYPPFAATYGQGIEQSLRGMFMCAVTGIHNGAVYFTG